MATNFIQQAIQRLAKPTSSPIPNTPNVHTQQLLQSLTLNHTPKQSAAQVLENKLLNYLIVNVFCFESMALSVCEVQCFKHLRESLFNTNNYYSSNGWHIYNNNSMYFIKSSGGGDGFFSLKTFSPEQIIKLQTKIVSLEDDLKRVSTQLHETRENSHSNRKLVNYHKDKNMLLQAKLRNCSRIIKLNEYKNERISKQRKLKSNQLRNIRRIYKYNKERIINIKDVNQKEFNDEMIANIYRTGLTVSFENVSKILTILCKHLQIDYKVPKKTKISEIVRSQIQLEKETWASVLKQQVCTLSFDIASADSFPYLQIITSIPKINDELLSQMDTNIPKCKSNGYSFELVKEFQAVQLIQHASELIHLPSKEANNVKNAVLNHINDLELKPLFYITDGGSENVGSKNGASTQLIKQFNGAKVVCSAHKLHTIFEKAIQKVFPEQTEKTIDWIIRHVRNNWSKFPKKGMAKPKQVLKTRWLSFIVGAEYILKYQKEISSFLQSQKKKSTKAVRARETFQNPKFWICCHILAGFGHLFFTPAFTWIQIDKGRRAPLMAKQITKWLLLLKHIENSPETYFSSTLTSADMLKFSKEETVKFIQSFSKECQDNISMYFNDWFVAPLNLASINDPKSAEKLVQDLHDHPEQYNLPGFHNEIILKQFMEYTARAHDGTSLKEFKELYRWWIITFGSLSVHNIACERGFSVMRYIHRTKLSAKTNLKSYLVQHAFEHDIPERAYLLNNILADNYSNEELVGLIEKSYQVMAEGTFDADMMLLDPIPEAAPTLSQTNTQENNTQDGVQQVETLSDEVMIESEQCIQSLQQETVQANQVPQLTDVIGSVFVVVANITNNIVNNLGNAIASILKSVGEVSRQQMMNYCLEMEHDGNKQYGFEKYSPSVACVGC